MAAPSIFVFNEAYYLAQNPDVAAAVAAGAIESGLAHWKVFGWAEGRTASKFFDWEVYRDNNPDLAEAGITTQADLTRHFNIYGVNENRVFLSSQVFDAQYYAAHNPDLAAAGITSLEALEQHFKSFGVYEGRIASPLIDGSSYISQQADLAALLIAGGNIGGFTDSDAAGIWHYYHYGISEGRSLGHARADDLAPTTDQTQPIRVSDTDSDGDYNAGDVIHLKFSEPVSVSSLAEAQFGVPGFLTPVGSANGYATEFQYVLAPGANLSAGNSITVGKQYVIDQSGKHAASDLAFVLPTLVDPNPGAGAETETADTVPPTILAFSVASPISLSVTSSEPGNASLWANSAHIPGSDGLITAANTPTTINVSPQGSVTAATMVVEDNVGLQTVSSTAVVLGTAGADASMTGTAGPNFMFGFAGDDSITGGAFADVIYGGVDNDTIDGGGGNDTINGGYGTDTLYASGAGATLADADFTDVSNMEAVTLASGSYSASVVLGTNANAAFANGVTVTIDPLTTVDALINGSAYSHGMAVTGGTQNDSIIGGSDNDTITGGDGNDTMTGGAGTNTFNVDSVTDTITDLKAGDTLNVAAGAYAYVSLLDLTTATVSNDGTIYVTGTSGSDLINGSHGLDIVLGGNGNDTINGGLGNDQLYGEDGDDIFLYTNNLALDADITVDGGDGTDRIQFTTAITSPGNFHTYFARSSSIEEVQFFGANSVNVGTGFQTAGITTVITGDDNTTLQYDDPVVGTITVDTTYLADDKTLTLTEFGPTTQGVHAFAVTNLKGNVDASAIYGWGTGRVSVTAASGMGFDVSVIGGGGADTITGGLGDDTIDGGAGNDSITGGAGVDNIWVGSGVDTVIFNAVAGSTSDSNVGVGWDNLQDIKLSDFIRINASNVNQFSVTSNVTAYGTDYHADINANGYSAGDVYIRVLGDLFASFGIDYAAMQTKARSQTIVNLTGTNLADTLGGSDNNDTLTGGSGNDSLSGLGGADIILDGAGEDEVTAGVGADEITLATDNERDNINQQASDGVAATATVFQGAVFAVGDTITFDDGVDVVANFEAGASVSADLLTVGTTLSTSLLGGATGARTIGWLSGNYDSVTHVFTITPNGTGSDTLVLKGSDLSAGASRAVVLVGVDSDQLVDSNFAGTDINIVPLYDVSTDTFTFQAGSGASNRLYIQTASSTPTGGAAAEGYIYNSSSYTTLQADASPNPATGFSQAAVTSINLSNLAGDAGVDIKIDGAGGSTNLASVTGTSGGDNFVYASQDFGAANATVDGGSAGTDTVTFTTAAGGRIYGISAGSGMQIANIDVISLTSGSAGRITLDASVSNAIAVRNASTTDGATVTLNTHSGSSYLTSSFGTDSVTLGAAGQTVSLLGGGDLVNGGALSLSGSYTATGSANTFTLGGGTLGAATILGFQTLNLTDSESISAATTLGLTTLTMTDNDVLTMTAVQNLFLQGSASVVGANQSVILTSAGNITGIDGIETYNLANGTNTFSFSTVASQSANGSGGVDTFVMRGNATAAGNSGNDIYQVLSGTNNVITTLGFGPSSPVVQVSAGATATGTTSGDWTAGVGSSNAGSVTINVDGAAGGAYTLDLHNATGTQGWILNGLGKVGIMIGSSQGDAITAGDTVYGRTVTITGGAGIDSIYGPTGSSGDKAVFNVASGAELDEDATVVGGTATDTINFTSAATDIDDADFANVLNVDKVQLADGVNVATLGLNAAAAGVRSITGGTGSDTIDASTMGVAVTIDAGQGDDTLIVGATAAAGTLGLGAGANTVSLASGGSLAGATTTATGGSWNLSLADNASVTLRSANLSGGSGVQLSGIIAAGTEAVTVNTTSGVLTGYTLDTAIENWNVGTVGNGNNSVTLGAVAQNVTFGSGNDTMTLGLNGTQGSYDMGAGTNTINLASGISVSAATISATGGTYGLNLLDGGALFDTTIKTALLQNAATVTTTSSGAITLRVDATGSGFVNKQIDADIDVLRIVAGNYANSITLLGGSQSFYGGAGDDTVNIGGRTMTSTLDFGGGAANSIVATNGANIAGVNGGLSTTANALSLTGGITMTAVQYADFIGQITAGGLNDSITLTAVLGSAAVLDSGVETFVFANVTGNSVTTGASGQTLNADALGDGRSLTLSGGNNVTVTLVSGDLSARAATGNLTVTATTGTNVIETGSGNDSITGGTGVDQIDISAGGTDHITLGNSANGIDVITGFSSNDTFHFAGLANGYENDSATDYSGEATLSAAADAAASGGPGYEAIGFIYQGNQYILINVNTVNYIASEDALVQVIGTNLATLSASNFNV